MLETTPATRAAPAPPADPVAPARPLVVVWRVNEACDLDCAYCEFARGHGGPRRSARAADVVGFGRVLAEAQARTGRRVLLSFLGGEPLLWPPLWRVSAALRTAGLGLSVTTNGTRLGAPGVVQALCAHFSEVTVSVDGGAEQHDTLRRAPGLHARLRAGVKALHAARAAVGHGPRLRANTVLTHASVRGLEALAVELAGWGIEALTFNALGGEPGDPFFDRERLRPADLAWLAGAVPGMRARLRARGLRLLGTHRYLERLAWSAHGVPVPVADCRPGADFLFVGVDGHAAPCSFTGPAYGIPVRALATPAALLALRARFERARAARPAGPCADCPSTQHFDKFEEVRS
jgi:MoaA/NifB/PqqE/SkfB family radical SAM enzyme